jgi:TonB family protein
MVKKRVMKLRIPLLLGLLTLAASARAQQSTATASKPTLYNPVEKGGSRWDPVVRRAYAVHFKVIDRPGTQFTLPTPKSRALPRPIYASGQLITGDCLLAFVVTADGHAVDPIILESSDRRLNSSVLAVIRDWRFTPARLDGSPVAIIFGAPVKFQKRAGT